MRGIIHYGYGIVIIRPLADHPRGVSQESDFAAYDVNLVSQFVLGPVPFGFLNPSVSHLDEFISPFVFYRALLMAIVGEFLEGGGEFADDIPEVFFRPVHHPLAADRGSAVFDAGRLPSVIGREGIEDVDA